MKQLGRKHGCEPDREDSKPLTEEERRQLEEADAALRKHGFNGAIADLAPSERIRVAPYARVLRQVEENIEERKRALAEGRTPPACWPPLPSDAADFD